MPKSPDAFRTISEVADWLDVQAHVLRFWESKFSQVKPIKRAGGRRYYRPNDMLLLGGIKKLLHEDGLTIKGVQKILREEGMGHVAAMSAPLDDQLAEVEETAPASEPPAVEEETAVVLDFTPAEAAPKDIPADANASDSADPASVEVEEVAQEDASALPDFVQQPLEIEAEVVETDNLPAEDPVSPGVDTADETDPSVEAEPETTDAAPPEPEAAPETAEAEPPAPKPRIIEMPPLTPEAEIAAAPATLTAAFRLPGLSAAQARDIAPLLKDLSALRDRMQAARQGPGAKG